MVLYQCKGAIMGSSAQEMLTGGIYDRPRDLNIVVPQGGSIGFEHWLNDCGYENEENIVVRGNLITVSEAKGQDLFQILVNGPSTADMNLMTAEPYMAIPMLWLFRALVGPAGRQDMEAGTHFGNINGGRINVQPDTRFMGNGCSAWCPSIWRTVRADENIAVVNWARRYSVYSIAQNSQTEWRLLPTCMNPFCDSYNGRVQWPVPGTRYEIARRQRDIVDHNPVSRSRQESKGSARTFCQVCAMNVIEEAMLPCNVEEKNIDLIGTILRR
ncbi:hypothetical protein BJ138DRAFT_1106255 [Hygrophoropsis aurantiaca]|uniref:Uncharacterized protein n=1 Tax=Hygrophoropsis aurantiaca TaxID=72124 RepID=A0ACB7ZV66_9AGAM|nr:hypothetical protein BJ138DRAFT_1106255 [Hygrophoropsis aurantiaca]